MQMNYPFQLKGPKKENTTAVLSGAVQCYH